MAFKKKSDDSGLSGGTSERRGNREGSRPRISKSTGSGNSYSSRGRNDRRAHSGEEGSGFESDRPSFSNKKYTSSNNPGRDKGTGSQGDRNRGRWGDQDNRERNSRPSRNDNNSEGSSYRSSNSDRPYEKKRFGSRPDRDQSRSWSEESGQRRTGNSERSSSSRPDRKPYGRNQDSGTGGYNDRRRSEGSSDENRFKKRNEGFEKRERPSRFKSDRPSEERSFGNRRRNDSSEGYQDRRSRDDSKSTYPAKRPFKPREREEGADQGFKDFTPGRRPEKRSFGEHKSERPSYSKSKGFEAIFDKPVRLNKFIANAGICSRREADILIQTGAISVNDEIITTLGAKVNPGDIVKYGDEPLMAEKKVYLLLNKPKDFITTTDDPEGRRTVLDLVKKACPERVFPVGRLDRETLGLLLLTNDGEMAKKLTHPSHQVQKVYHVYLDKNLTKTDMQRLVDGVELEDGMAFVDTISFAGTGEDKSQVGVEIHSGKNRIVRRLFDAIGYKVIKLDRVMFAGLTKKDLPRGHYRFLSLKEVNYLKMI